MGGWGFSLCKTAAVYIAFLHRANKNNHGNTATMTIITLYYKTPKVKNEQPFSRAVGVGYHSDNCTEMKHFTVLQNRTQTYIPTNATQCEVQDKFLIAKAHTVQPTALLE